jgi:hypothetical protein
VVQALDQERLIPLTVEVDLDQYFCYNSITKAFVCQGRNLKEIVEQAGNGFVSLSGDDNEIYKNALSLLDSNTRKEMGKKSSLLLIDKFSIQKITKQKRLEKIEAFNYLN